ncbi:unnamed protein product [Brassica oleracea]
MRQWRITQGCVQRNETRDHLFFACPYTYTVWTNLTDKLLGRFITPDWNETVRSLLQTTHSQIDNILLRMLFQTALHDLWRERNSRRCGGARVSVEAMTRVIDNAIALALASELESANKVRFAENFG